MIIFLTLHCNPRLLLVTIRLHLVKQMQTSMKILGICFGKQIQILVWYLSSLLNEDRKSVFVRAYLKIYLSCIIAVTDGTGEIHCSTNTLILGFIRRPKTEKLLCKNLEIYLSAKYLDIKRVKVTISLNVKSKIASINYHINAGAK